MDSYMPIIDNLEMDMLLEMACKNWVKKKHNLSRLINRHKIKSIIKKVPCKQKSRTGWLPWGILPDIQRTYTCSSQKTISKKKTKRKEHCRFILWDHHHPDIKIKDTTKKERYRPISLMNMDENPHKVLNKSNSTICKKDHTSWSSWFIPGVARTIQNIPINHYDILHYKKERQKTTWSSQ